MKQVLKSFCVLSLILILSASVSFAASKHNRSKGVDYSMLYTKESSLINGVLINNYFGKDGEFIGSSSTLSYNQLSAVVKQTIANKYLQNGYSIKESISFTNKEDETTYYLKLTGIGKSVILQITNGKYISVLKV